MRGALKLLVWGGVCCMPVADCRAGDDGQGEAGPTALLGLEEQGETTGIAIEVMVDGVSFEAYWDQTVDAIFEFADGNEDGAITSEELSLVPSARSVRLSLGTGYSPPVAAIGSMAEIAGRDVTACSKEDLKAYYQSHGVGRVLIGVGHLPHTDGLTASLIRALDVDEDGRVSRDEMDAAESRLRQFDTNDDELVGVGELLPNATYPGREATDVLVPFESVMLSDTGAQRLSVTLYEQGPASGVSASGSSSSGVSSLHRQGGEDADVSGSTAGDPADSVVWRIAISDGVDAEPFTLPTDARCESWVVRGSLAPLHEQIRTVIAEAGRQEDASSDAGDSETGSALAWLTSLVDRDHDGTASQPEIDAWLDLQREIIRGQLLISIYAGGGLFEVLDRNHDAGLSIREMRTAWQELESCSCTSESAVDMGRIPEIVFFTASQGYAKSLAHRSTSEVEWFGLMDRNADQDVSRQEFTGPPAAFARLDQDGDSLISLSEAKSRE